MLNPGTRLADRYVVERELGAGGMGIVYRAADEQLGGAPVAVKALRIGFDAEVLKRFQREVDTWQRLPHPHIVPVLSGIATHQVDELRELYWFVLEYQGGGTLERAAAELGKLTVEEAVEMVEPVLDALEFAHAQGVVHRDVKPANVLLDDLGRPKLSDFGLVHVADASRLTHVHDLLGTPAFCPPEQLRGEPVDPAWDVFACAATLYVLLTGRRPAAPSGAEGAVRRELDIVEQLRASGVPEAVADVVVEALAWEVDRRCATSRDLRVALRLAVQSLLVSHVPNRIGPDPGSEAEREDGLVDGRFELGAFLGGGRTGRVFRSRDHRLDRDVALKFVLDASLARQVESEARSLARLSHPNIVAIHDRGMWERPGHEPQPYLVLELVDGTALTARTGTPMSALEAIGIVEQALEGLAHAHERGIVHCDLKPDNLLVDGAGTVKIADFGFAHEVDADSDAGFAGSAAYAAPERFRGARLPASDVWSMAVVLHELLVGTRPRGAGSSTSTGSISEARVVDASVLGAAVPTELGSLLARALDPDPERRHSDAGELLGELRRARADIETGSSWAGRRRVRKRIRREARAARRRTWRWRVRAALLTVCMVSIAVAATWFVWEDATRKPWRIDGLEFLQVEGRASFDPTKVRRGESPGAGAVHVRPDEDLVRLLLANEATRTVELTDRSIRLLAGGETISDEDDISYFHPDTNAHDDVVRLEAGANIIVVIRVDSGNGPPTEIIIDVDDAEPFRQSLEFS